MAENPMMAKMLANMIGMTPEQLSQIATSFGNIGQYAYLSLQRIERKLDILLDAVNEQRTGNGGDPITFERTPERSNGGGGGGNGPGGN